MGKVAPPAHKFNQVIGGIIIRLKNSERERVDTPCMKTVDTWRVAFQDKFDFHPREWDVLFSDEPVSLGKVPLWWVV
jgi:hypothetical protein